MSTVKPFSIPKPLVFEAYRRVRTGGKSPGVDKQTLADFDKNRNRNLYRLWNRMSSGSYFPPPVKRVEIPKDSSGTRPLGIPTLTDRIAQMVVKIELEQLLEPHFHPDSYGYRPGKSALDAIAQARDRCWKYAWVVDLDIKGFFDNIDHTLLLKAVEHHTPSAWHRLYIKRWLQAPVSIKGELIHTGDKGTPQGGVISPLLANLYPHYAFDMWMKRSYPEILFERHADDIVIHARNQKKAQLLKEAISNRLHECKLELHPEKTKIVFCKQWNRRGEWSQQTFDFLGYGFRPRQAINRNKECFSGFLPAVSKKALKRMRQAVRQWQLKSRCHLELAEISKALSPTISGWMQYYGRYYSRELNSLWEYIDTTIARWACLKYRRFHGRMKQARAWLTRLAKREATLFPHWKAKTSLVVGQ